VGVEEAIAGAAAVGTVGTEVLIGMVEEDSIEEDLDTQGHHGEDEITETLGRPEGSSTHMYPQVVVDGMIEGDRPCHALGHLQDRLLDRSPFRARQQDVAVGHHPHHAHHLLVDEHPDPLTGATVVEIIADEHEVQSEDRAVDPLRHQRHPGPQDHGSEEGHQLNH
jgi:hypothetical protein